MTAEREKYVEKNLGLAHSCARRYTGKGIDYDDLYQTACVGLIKAAENFDEKRKLQFSTYAVPVILGELKQLFRNSGSIKASRRLKEMGIKARKISDEFCVLNGRSPRISELADLLEVSQQDAAEALCVSMPAESLEAGSLAECASSIAFEESTTDILAVRQLVSGLAPNDRELICRRYIDGLTQSGTARMLGMTQVQISRRERRLLEFLRTEMSK